ncbi:MAG TPA: ABC transporter ATP-binding protein [Candidatus Krumholzibacteria bacterium]|nr:ABC transporter ATP-binding protein [Candidatus Krumholzibacteria bacterium]
MSEHALECERITKRYGRIAALNSVDLAVDRGECVAIFGRNGAGKTTLLHVAGSLIRAYDGTVRVFGQRRADADSRRAVGLVLHETCLYDDLSVSENLRFFARLYDVDDADHRVQDVLTRFDLFARAGSVVRTLSRGMKQRLAIARAMVHAPRLVLMDEPFTGLDEPSSQTLVTVLRDFVRDGGAVVMSTHDVERAFDVATRAIVLERGSLTLDRSLADVDAAAFRHAYWHVLFTGTARE